MPTAQEILVHVERAQAQHFKMAGLLFAGNGGGLLAFTVFKDDLAPPSGAMVVVSGIAAIAFLLSVLIIRKIAKDPPHPAARPLILLNMSSVLVGLAAMIATSVVCLVWFVLGW